MARVFDETDDEVHITDSVDITLPDGDWTVLTWIKLLDNVGTLFQYFLSWGAFDANPSFNFFIFEESNAAPNIIKNQLKDAGGDSATLQSTDTNPGTDREWQVLLIERSGNTVKIFRNGVELATVTNTLFDDVNVAGDFFIGTRAVSPAGRWFGGDMAHVGKLDLVLTQNQKDAMFRGIPLFAFGLARKFDLPLLGKSPEPDFSGNGNTGTPVSGGKAASNPPVELLENYL